MRVVFMGTPDFAAASLRALLAGGYDIAGVFTQPDKPRNRGMKESFSPVKELAVASGLPVFQPVKLRDGSAEALLRSLAPDVLVVVAYGLILPQKVLELPRAGCLNIHASLLPRWRGAAPIHRAIEAGDAETGVCIMQMDAGLDTGGVVD